MFSFRSANTRAPAAIACAATVVIAAWTTPARAQCEDQKILPPSGAMFDRFGTRIAMSGNVLVISEANDDTISTNSGAVYVYRFDGATWNFEAELFASDAGFIQQFGTSVAIDGDTMVVGSTGVNSNTGAAYVFRFDGATWSEEVKLTASDGVGGDLFGASVAIDGNVLFSSSPSDTTTLGGNDAGSVYVFRFNGANWIPEAHVFASNEAPNRYSRFANG